MKWVEFNVTYIMVDDYEWTHKEKLFSGGARVKPGRYRRPWYYIKTVKAPNGGRYQKKVWVPEMTLALVEAFEQKHGEEPKIIVVDYPEYSDVEEYGEMIERMVEARG